MNDQTNIPRRPVGRPPNNPQSVPTPEQAVAGAAAVLGEDAPRGAVPRIPFGTPQSKLGLPERVGFKRRYFNDIPGRIDRAKNAGYAHVMDRGSPVSTIVGVAKEGGGLTAYAMEIPLELYDADQAVKMNAIDEFDEAIRSGIASGKAPGQDGRYVPVDAYGKPKISLSR